MLEEHPGKIVAELATKCVALLDKELSPAQRKEVRQWLLGLYIGASERGRLDEADLIALRRWAASELSRCANEPDPIAAAKELLDGIEKGKQPAKRGRGRPKGESDEHIAAVLLVRDLVKKGWAVSKACEAVAKKAHIVEAPDGSLKQNTIHWKTLEKKYRAFFKEVER